MHHLTAADYVLASAFIAAALAYHWGHHNPYAQRLAHAGIWIFALATGGLIGLQQAYLAIEQLPHHTVQALLTNADIITITGLFIAIYAAIAALVAGLATSTISLLSRTLAQKAAL